MRLFAALPVVGPAQRELTGLLQTLRERDWPVRWIRAEGIHLTLKFFGPVPPDRILPIENALSHAADGFGPIPLACSGLGSFPPGKRARVVWVGVEGASALELLQDRVERACEAEGYPLEGRPFRPHITLGRVQEGRALPPEAFAGIASDLEVPFLADRMVLFESKPGPGGSVYRPHRTFALSSCAAV